MTNSQIWPYITDDFSPAREDFHPTEHDGLWYVLAFEEQDLLGMWCFVPHSGICWEVHTYLLPGHGWRRGREAARAMAEWIWQHTSCERIYTSVPDFNRAARLFARAAGMTEFGHNPASFLRHGRRYGQTLLGISKPL